jgi:hypothetical protein
MYRSFVRSKENKTTDRVTSVHNFLGGYVLPNMLPHHVDITLFNRLVLKLKGVNTKLCDSTPEAYKHPFNLIDITGGLEHVLDKIVFNTTSSNPSLYKAMKNTPLAFNDDLYSLCKEDYVTRSKQADWLLALGKLKYISYLYEVCGDSLLNTNRSDVTNAANALVRNEAARIIVSRIKATPLVQYKTMQLLEYISDRSESYRLAAQLK